MGVFCLWSFVMLLFVVDVVDFFMQIVSVISVFGQLWIVFGQLVDVLLCVMFMGVELVLLLLFVVGILVQSIIVVVVLVVVQVDMLCSGRQQIVLVDMYYVVLEFCFECYFCVDGQLLFELWDKIVGLYCCGDGCWVCLYINFVYYCDGVLKLFGCVYDWVVVVVVLN